MQAVLKRVQSDTFSMYIVWLPALLSDGRKDAVEASGECSDPRIKYYWDEEKETGEVYKQTLGIERFAWDVYFLYDRGVRWTVETPPQPKYWMHQLWGLEETAPLLDSAVLAQQIEAVLSSKIAD